MKKKMSRNLRQILFRSSDMFHVKRFVVCSPVLFASGVRLSAARSPLEVPDEEKAYS